jgi:hypothetical protein
MYIAPDDARAGMSNLCDYLLKCNIACTKVPCPEE